MKKFYTFMIALFTFLSGLVIIPGCADYGVLPGEWEYYADEDGDALDEDALLLTNIEDDVEEDGEDVEEDEEEEQ